MIVVGHLAALNRRLLRRERVSNISRRWCCARVARNIMERFVTLGNLRFLPAALCNTFRQQKGHPQVAEMPMFIEILKWLCWQSRANPSLAQIPC
jgi:hypothetical protein